jgi:hypothetical protein
MWSYRYEAAHVAGFIQQLVRYVSLGYRYYVASEIPAGKDPAEVDKKLIERYGIGISKWARCRRKRAGLGNLQYLRFERFFVLLGTEGEHVFFRREKGVLRDIRETPLCFGGYEVRSVLCPDGRWHASARISDEKYRELRAYFLEMAPRLSLSAVASEIQTLPFEPWGPVRAQFHRLRREAERARRAAGFRDRVPRSCVRERRRPIRAFKGGGEGS